MGGELTNDQNCIFLTHRQISSAFSSTQGILLLPLVKPAATILSSLAIRIDQMTKSPRQPAANETSRVILRAFNIALGDRTTGNNLGKKEAAFHLANILFKLYFKVGYAQPSSPIYLANLPTARPNPPLPYNSHKPPPIFPSFTPPDAFSQVSALHIHILSRPPPPIPLANIPFVSPPCFYCSLYIVLTMPPALCFTAETYPNLPSSSGYPHRKSPQ